MPLFALNVSRNRRCSQAERFMFSSRYTYAPPLGAWGSADEARRLYFGKMEPRMFATVYATFRHTETFHKG